MKLDVTTFRQLRRLAPVLDDILNAGEVENPDQAVNLAALVQLCSELFDAYHCIHPTRLRKLASTPLNRNNKTLSDLSGGFRERRHHGLLALHSSRSMATAPWGAR
jgi:hypothetical protein